MLHAIIDD